MLDLDNTLAPWQCQDVSVAVERWMEELHATELRACIVTNAALVSRVQPVADRLRIPWILKAYKPLAGGMRRGMRLLGTSAAQTAMVGDMLLTDILGGNRLGLFTILVDPINAQTEDPLVKLLQRPAERMIMRLQGIWRATAAPSVT
jgi:HAD superfamily phosphatase (TIGR01668 family)